MGDAIGALMSVMLVMAVCGSFGYKIAKDQGRDPVRTAIFCAMIPVVGVGLLLMIGRKKGHGG